MMMAEAANLMAVMAIVAAMAGVDADGQGFGGPGAQHGKREGGDNEFFHDNIPWKRCGNNAVPLSRVPVLGTCIQRRHRGRWRKRAGDT